MQINVTQEHISKGVSQDGCLCPVALALIDSGFTDVFAGCYELEYDNHNSPTPDSVASFIKHFDQYQTGTPFTFNLEINP